LRQRDEKELFDECVHNQSVAVNIDGKAGRVGGLQKCYAVHSATSSCPSPGVSPLILVPIDRQIAGAAEIPSTHP